MRRSEEGDEDQEEVRRGLIPAPKSQCYREEDRNNSTHAQLFCDTEHPLAENEQDDDKASL